MKNLIRSLMAFAMILTVSMVAAAQQATPEVQSNPNAQCKTREVIVMVKSTPGVHYSEKDEGQIISKYTVLDCGSHLVVDPTTRVDLPASGIRKCPPNVQDCIRP